MVHTRGAPLDAVIADVIAPTILSRQITHTNTMRQEFYARCVAMDRDGLMGRAWAAVEIALLGLEAAAHDLPLWARLCASQRRLDVLLIEGYYIDGEGDDEFVSRLSQRVIDGYSLLKVSISQGATAGALTRRIERLRGLHPEARLVVDCAWSFTSAAEAIDALAPLADLGLEWIEDPFPRDAVDHYLQLSTILSVPIAAGDEVSRSDDLLRLVDHADVRVPRIDALSLGGIAAALDAARALRQRGARLSFHEQPEIHQHIALASLGADHVECFPPDRPFDMRSVLMEQSTSGGIENGLWSPTVRPGLGIALDLESVRRHAYRYTRHAA